MTTEKRAERTERHFRCSIFRSAIGQGSCSICAPPSSDVPVSVPVLLLGAQGTQGENFHARVLEITPFVLIATCYESYKKVCEAMFYLEYYFSSYLNVVPLN